MPEQDNRMDEAQIAQLLQKVGARTPPPDEVAASVRENVRAVWQEEVNRRRRSRTRNFAMAASIVMAMAASWYVLIPAPRAGPVAHVALESGVIEVLGSDNQWYALDSADVSAGATVRTLDESYLTLDLTNGANLRVDANSVVTLSDVTLAELDVGAVYVDSDRDSADIDIRTSFGVAEEIGTRFEVRASPTSWRVQVRDGKVRVTDDAIDELAIAGQRIDIRDDDTVTFASIPANDPSWLWAERAATPFPIEGATLRQYLSWVSRETGNPIVFDSIETEAAAMRTVLHGSIEGLSPQESLDVVLATTNLRRVSSGDNSITIAK